jgi:ketosteroid isomerase-like protein
MAAIAGCGESDEEQAREVVQDYVDAQNADDFDRICELYSDGLKQELGIEENCPGFVEEASSGAEGEERFEIVDVRVSDERATAELDVSRESEGPARIGITLEREDGEWRVVRLQ